MANNQTTVPQTPQQKAVQQQQQTIQQGQQPKTQPRPNWQEEAEAKLTQDGWKRSGFDQHRGQTLWGDPLGGKPIPEGKDKHKVELTTVGGGRETISQKIIPGCTWNYVTEEALGIQRARDEQRKAS